MTCRVSALGLLHGSPDRRSRPGGYLPAMTTLAVLWRKRQTAETRETEAGITMKLKRGTFAATFFLACLVTMELEGVVLEEI